MTLDEAIKHAEEVAEEQEKLYRLCPVADYGWCEGDIHCKSMSYEYDGCLKCADEHRQLAEWLRDYKRLKEQESKTEEVIKMRDATPEEREAIAKYIKSISKPTGIEFDEESNDDLISKTDTLAKFNKRADWAAYQIIKGMPLVNPRPKTGHWEYRDIANSTITGYWCDQCHIGSSKAYDYCPNCGAKMEVEQNG